MAKLKEIQIQGEKVKDPYNRPFRKRIGNKNIIKDND